LPGKHAKVVVVVVDERPSFLDSQLFAGAFLSARTLEAIYAFSSAQPFPRLTATTRAAPFDLRK